MTEKASPTLNKPHSPEVGIETPVATPPVDTSRRAIIAGSLMAASSALAYSIMPRTDVLPPPPHLANNVPKQFGPWSYIADTSPVLPDAATQATIDKIYDETLARTYRRADDQSVMLVIAYGSRQTDSLRAHRPDVCYAAQGFNVSDRGSSELSSSDPVPVTKLYATQGPRTEPIVYWMAVGGKVTGFGLNQRLQQFKAAFHGGVPDGFLVRASLIGHDEPQSYRVLEEFLTGLLSVIPNQLRLRMAGF